MVRKIALKISRSHAKRMRDHEKMSANTLEKKIMEKESI